MLKIADKMSQLNIAQLKNLYDSSIRQHANAEYFKLNENLRILQSEQDFYADLEMFFRVKGARCALWLVDGVYVSGLRAEPYKDGYLITSLETHPEARRRGYGTALMKAVSNYFNAVLYSHVNEGNIPSRNLHLRCNFRRTDIPAIFVDGTVHNDFVIYVLDK